MEILYCDECGFRIGATDVEQGRVVKADGKTFCLKCRPAAAPQPARSSGRATQPNIPRPSAPTPANGTRRTPHGRAESEQEPSLQGFHGTHGTHGTHVTPPRAKSGTSGYLLGAIGGAIVLLLVLLQVMSSGSGPGNAQKTAPVANKSEPKPSSTVTPPVQSGKAQTGQQNQSNKSAPPVPMTQPKPATTAATPTPPDTQPPGETKARALTAEELAQNAFNATIQFDGVAKGDLKGRIDKLEGFLKQYGESIVASRARIMLNKLKRGDVSDLFEPPPLPPGYVLGLKTEFYKGRDFAAANKLRERVDDRISFFWNEAPDEGVPVDNFSVRWEGYINIPSTDTYIFSLNIDDGARLYIDGEKVIDDWRESSPHVLKADRKLTEGPHALKLEFFEAGGAATCTFSWSFKGRPASYVPSGVLMRKAGAADNTVKPANAAGAEEPGAVYLSSLKEEDVTVGSGTFGKNGKLGYKINGSDDITVKGVRASHGLSLHPPAEGVARVYYKLAGAYKTLRMAVALNDSAVEHKAGVIFEVNGDGKTLWTSERLAGAGARENCEVDVSGVDKVQLRVRAPGSNEGAHAVFIEPRVLK